MHKPGETFRLSGFVQKGLNPCKVIQTILGKCAVIKLRIKIE